MRRFSLDEFLIFVIINSLVYAFIQILEFIAEKLEFNSDVFVIVITTLITYLVYLKTEDNYYL